MMSISSYFPAFWTSSSMPSWETSTWISALEEFSAESLLTVSTAGVKVMSGSGDELLSIFFGVVTP